MPEFYDVSRHFDDTSVYDAYTLAYAFDAQFGTFDQQSMDGSLQKKRTMSCAPNLVIPQRRVLNLYDEAWLVGDGNVDMMANVAVRKNYWMKKSSGLAVVSSPAQVLAATKQNGVWTIPGQATHVALEYLKDTVNTQSEAEYDPFWNVYAAPIEGLHRGQFVSLNGTLYRIRTSHLAISGLTCANADELDPLALRSIIVSPGGIDPVTELPVTAPVTVNGIYVDYYTVYEYMTEADYKMVSGDKGLYLATRLATGTSVSIDNESWKVVGSRPDEDAFLHHLRRS